MTKRKPRKPAPAKPPAPVGRPTDYRPEYCQKLIAHMAQGHTFRTFGITIGVHADTTSDWCKAHPEFLQARKDGTDFLERHFADMGVAIATGQLRRVASEKPIIVDGKPVLGPDGKVMYERTYEPTQGNATAWIFLTKNILGWRNENHLVHSAETEPRSRASDLSPEERMREIAEMTKALQEIEHAKAVIEVESKPA